MLRAIAAYAPAVSEPRPGAIPGLIFQLFAEIRGVYGFIDFACRLWENPPIGLSASMGGGRSKNIPARLVVGCTVLLACAAGWMDWRSRRIPNWLTVPGLLIGLGLNAAIGGWLGLRSSLLGAGLGLLLLLPFVLLKALGAGDWKLAGALGAFVGPAVLTDLLLASVFVAGLMALGLVIYRRRVRETLRNMAHLLASLFTLHRPGPQVSLDNPQSLKVPYGVALALTVIAYGAGHIWGVT